jgi:hypothetical protein
MLFIFTVFWLLMGGLTLYFTIWYSIQKDEDDEITLEMIPILILMGLIWPITLCVILGDWWKENKQKVVWKGNRDE